MEVWPQFFMYVAEMRYASGKARVGRGRRVETKYLDASARARWPATVAPSMYLCRKGLAWSPARGQSWREGKGSPVLESRGISRPAIPVSPGACPTRLVG